MLGRNGSPIRKRSFHRDAVLVVRGGRGTNRRSSTSARVVFRASRCEMSDERQEEVDVVRRCEAEARVRLKQEQDTGGWGSSGERAARARGGSRAAHCSAMAIDGIVGSAAFWARHALQRLNFSPDEELLCGDGVWPRDRLLTMDASYTAAVERAFELGLESRAAAAATVSFRNGKAAALEG